MYLLLTALLLLFCMCNKKETQTVEGQFRYLVYIQKSDQEKIPVIDNVLEIGNLALAPWIYFLPAENAYLYLLLFAPERQVYMLFPYSTSSFPSGYEKTAYNLPGEGWDEYLTAPGEYQLYFFVSANRIKNLETLIYRYNINRRSGDPGDSNKKIYNDIFAEVQWYRKKYLWVQNIKNLPLHQAGVVRSGEGLPGVIEVNYPNLFIKSYYFNYKRKESL